ncbi:putative protein- and DDB1-associated protein 1 [Orchesella cincta]|uniref:DET1- and DDB1-associated protein 1 n=1 Tax=Orchesella cincta TaxID=48709 RepID=A0A1D2NDN7_ORCCI|nr:putative protein- and DDB1-associated protein 1 [Orchesella cincta]
MACQAVADFLSGLPSRDPHNFQKWCSDGPKQNITRKPASYVPTKDIPSQQVIVTEKTNILLRYLHQQYEKKAVKHGTKRDGASGSADEEVQRKRARYDV